jgi:hypothetical protein
MACPQGSCLLYGPSATRTCAQRPDGGSLVLLDPHRRVVSFGNATTSLTGLEEFGEKEWMSDCRVSALKTIGDAAGVPVSRRDLLALIDASMGMGTGKPSRRRDHALRRVMRTLCKALREKLVVNPLEELEDGSWRWCREDLRLCEGDYVSGQVFLPGKF